MAENHALPPVPKRLQRKNFPPAPEEVTAYSAEIGYPMDGAAWCDSYAQKGWKVGKAVMTDWQAAVRNWKRNRWGLGTVTIGTPKTEAPQDYTKI